MTDKIIDGLKEVLEDSMAQGDENGVSRYSLALKDAIAEIERLRATIDQLRAVAGAVSLDSGLTFGAIKGKIQSIPSSVTTTASGYDFSTKTTRSTTDAIVDAMHQRRDVIAAQVLNEQFDEPKPDNA